MSNSEFLTDEEAVLWKRAVIALCASPNSVKADLWADHLVQTFRARVEGLRDFQAKQEGVVSFISQTYYGGYGDRGARFHEKLKRAIAEFHAEGESR